ncbi:MAG TPA: hypothetical protein VLA16_12155 [Ideonella sp.]|nr:hypothetical protein [Ideonella sp.]
MKPKLLLHIGTPKTGTTTIQAALFEARTRLLTDCKTLFPTTSRGKSAHRHTSIANAIKAGLDEQALEFKEIMSEFERSGAQQIFITDEGLALKARTAPFFQRFERAGFDISVVCYVRRWDYFAESLYNQVIRLKNYKGVPPINEFWRDDKVISKMDYSEMLSPWEDISSEMIVRDFHKEVASDGGLLESFKRACGFEALGDIDAPRRNVSRDMRMLMLLCHSSPGNSVDDLKALALAVGGATRRLIETGVLKPFKYLLGTDEREELLSTMRANSTQLTDDHGIDFADDRPREPKDPLLAPDAAYMLAVMGELSVIELLRLHKCLKWRLTELLGEVPDGDLLDASMDGQEDVPGAWLSALDEDEFATNLAAEPEPELAAASA